MENVIALEGVTKRFGTHLAVDDLSLTVAAGTIHGFLGPNGAGKTTTLRMITGILLPDSGRIEVLGHDRADAVRERVGYLPEEKGLYKKMRAAEIVAYFGQLRGMDAALAKARSREMLDRYGLGAWKDKRCEALSKGMGQKVQVLAALVHDPELVILDEPFSGLDPVNAEMLREVILDLKRRGRTVLFSTHVMEHAEQLCDAIVVIDRGRKVLDGSLAEVKRSADQAIQIDYDGDGSVLRTLRGVRRLNDSGKSCEIVLEPGVDPQEVLAALVGKIAIRRFDLREPSLHEVFVRVVGGAA